MNAAKVITKLVRTLPKLEGTQARFTIGSKQLAQITKENKDAGRVFKALTKGAKDPKIDVAYKAQENYAIAALRVKDVGKVYANGAISLTNPGQANSAIKYRLSLNNGKTLSANGFLDTAQPVNLNDISASVSRKNGILSESIRMGDTVGHNVTVNEKEMLKLGKSLRIDTSRYTDALAKGDKVLNHGMDNIRQIISGKWEDPFEKYFAKSFDKAEFAKITGKPKTFDPNAIKKMYDYKEFNKKINPDAFAKLAEKLKAIPPKEAKVDYQNIIKGLKNG